MLTESLRNATGCAEKSPKALLNAAKCPQIRSDSKQNSGRRWICRPRGARVTETANLFGVKFSQRFRAYEEGFRGGSVCCCAERGRGKPRAKEGSPTKKRRGLYIWIVLLFACTSFHRCAPFSLSY